MREIADNLLELERDPNDLQAWSSVLNALSELNEHKEVIGSLRLLATRDDLNWQSTIFAARALLAAGDSDVGVRHLRRAPTSASSRSQAIAATYEASWYDDKFQHYVVEGDARRDRGEWQGAEWRYWEAISCYPLHSGFTTQYAHVLKEQGKLIDAEMYYRTAKALDSDPELDIHIGYVASKNGYSDTNQKIVLNGAFSANLSSFATHYDIDTITRVLLGRILPVHDLLPIQRAITTVGDTIALVVSSAEFAHKRRNFLEVLLAQRENML